MDHRPRFRGNRFRGNNRHGRFPRGQKPYQPVILSVAQRSEESPHCLFLYTPWRFPELKYRDSSASLHSALRMTVEEMAWEKLDTFTGDSYGRTSAVTMRSHIVIPRALAGWLKAFSRLLKSSSILSS